jgi:hypothetical protein
VAIRYFVVAFGRTVRRKEPVVATVRNCVHGVPAVDRWITAPWTPRTSPVSVTLVPDATGGFDEGGCNDRTPTPNHVERRLRADAIAAPPVVAVSCEPRESEVTFRVFTRREEFRLTVASTTRPTAPTALPSVFPVTGTGPQS